MSQIVQKGGSGTGPGLPIDLTTDVTGILPVPNGGTGVGTLTDHGLMLGSGVGTVTSLAAAGNGEIPIGSVGADPVLGNITSTGGSITVTNGPGTINLETGAVSTEFEDDTFRIIDDGDNTKEIAFQASSITTGNVREITMCDQDLSLINPSFPGSVTGVNDITTTGGDVVIDAGILSLPTTNAALTEGVIEINGARFIHNYGGDNTFLGYNAGNGTNTGSNNIGIGEEALSLTTSASANVAVGNGNLGILTTGDSNLSIGDEALRTLTTGSFNAGIGFGALSSLITGSSNIGIGSGAGSGLTNAENGNVCVGALGVAGDNNTIRIGQQGAGISEQNKCYAAGIHNVTPSGGSDEMVIVDANGQLGSQAIPSGGGMSWSEVTGTTQAMAIDSGYLVNNAALVTLTLPDTAALFSIIKITGKGAGGWKIAQNAGESIIWDEQYSTTVGVGGSLEFEDRYDTVELQCTVADTTWLILSSKGNIDVI